MSLGLVVGDGRGSTPIRGGYLSPALRLPSLPSLIAVRLPYFPSVDQRDRVPSLSFLSPSNHSHSAVHVQRLAGHIGGLVGGEESNRGGDLFGRARAIRRNFRKDDLALLVVELFRHRRDDEAGRDAIGGDAAPGVFLGD